MELTKRLDPEFRDVLHSYDLEKLETHPGSVLLVCDDARIRYVNPAYLQFAEDNSPERWSWGPGLGERWLDGIDGPLRGWYERKLAEVSIESGPWTHEYDCPSPSLARRFHLMVYPMMRDARLLVHSLIFERPHPDLPPESFRDPEDYRNEHGMFVMCAHCRRARRPNEDEIWDWVPALLSPEFSPISHGFCPPCYGHYWVTSL